MWLGFGGSDKKRGVVISFGFRRGRELPLSEFLVYKLCLNEVLPFSQPEGLLGKLRRKTDTSPTVTAGAIKETFGPWGWGAPCLCSVLARRDWGSPNH